MSSFKANEISIINQEIIDIVGTSDEDAFNELMQSNDPLQAIKHAYKMICKTRNLTVRDYFLNL